ncbi:MAG TPA: DUF411 domain-containing protein [Gemmatimonadales bacterium]|nr:DUF411 domain-containing protein [Gemmatimonadales bacterium]
MQRRTFVGRIAGLVAAGVAGRRVWAELPPLAGKPTPITVYKSSTCECCAKWVDHIAASGFAPVVHDDEDMDARKDDMGVPRGVRSCHTGIVEKYLIEGHVPASDIRRLLAERPKAAGLAVPGMPPRTYGMAGPGVEVGGYVVVAFQGDGTTSVFARH